MTDKKILWLIVGISLMAITLGIGWLRFEKKQEELKRNRKYEVSLVKALKNSYAGIEEIEITDPNYTYPPGSWTCTIEISFSDNKSIKYRVNHSLKDQDISDVSLERENRFEDRKYLNNHLGQTEKKVNVYYSDGDRGKQ